MSNNPVNFNDPTGHLLEDDDDGGCYPCTPSDDEDDDLQPDILLPDPEDLPCGGLLNCSDSPVSAYAESLLPFTRSEACYFLFHDSNLCDSGMWKRIWSNQPFVSYPLSWFLEDIGITNADAYGLRVLDASGSVPFFGGMDLDIDTMYFTRSHELALFVSTGPQSGASGGLGITRGLLLGHNMPTSSAYAGGSYKMAGADAPLLWWGISAEADYSIGSINRDSTIPSTTYLGVGSINAEAGEYSGASFTYRFIRLQLP